MVAVAQIRETTRSDSNREFSDEERPETVSIRISLMNHPQEISLHKLSN